MIKRSLATPQRNPSDWRSIIPALSKQRHTHTHTRTHLGCAARHTHVFAGHCEAAYLISLGFPCLQFIEFVLVIPVIDSVCVCVCVCVCVRVLVDMWETWNVDQERQENVCVEVKLPDVQNELRRTLRTQRHGDVTTDSYTLRHCRGRWGPPTLILPS